MANSNEQVMASLRLPLMNNEENGDVVMENDKEEDKTGETALKPWKTDHHLYILSVVDCMMYKKDSSTHSIDWKEVSRLMSCSKKAGQADGWFTPKECENQYNYITKTFEKEKENKVGSLNHNDATTDQNLRVELFQKLMKDRKREAEENVIKLQAKITEVTAIIDELQKENLAAKMKQDAEKKKKDAEKKSDPSDEKMSDPTEEKTTDPSDEKKSDTSDEKSSDTSDANRTDSEPEATKCSLYGLQKKLKVGSMENDDFGMGDEGYELEFWSSLCSGVNAWGPELEALFGMRVEEHQEQECIPSPAQAKVIGPNRLVLGHHRRISYENPDEDSRSVSPKLSNLLDNAIASGKIDLMPSSRPMTPVNNAPTLSKLLEMPVRDRGQPLPTIQSLMEDSTAVGNRTPPHLARYIETISPTTLLNELVSPVKASLMGSPPTPVSPKVARLSAQPPATNTLPALTLLMPRTSSKNLTLPEDLDMDDTLERFDTPNVALRPVMTGLDHNKSTDPLTVTELGTQENNSISIEDGSDSEMDSENRDTSTSVASNSSAVLVTKVIESESEVITEGIDLSGRHPAEKESVDSSIVGLDADKTVDEGATATQNAEIEPSADSNNKSDSASVLEPNVEITIEVPTPGEISPVNTQPEDTSTADKRKSPVKAAARAKERTESEEAAEEEASNSGVDNSTPTRVTRRSVKAIFTKPSEEKNVVADDTHSLSFNKEQEETNDQRTLARLAKAGGKKHLESAVSDVETKDEDSGIRITRARNRASVVPRERTKSSSSAKGSLTTDQSFATSGEGESVSASDVTLEPDAGQDKDANDNEPNVPEKPEVVDIPSGADATEPEVAEKAEESSTDVKTESPVKSSGNDKESQETSQPTIVNDGKLSLDIDEESSDKESYKRKSPKPATRTKERIESGEMADDDNSNSGFDSSSTPRMTRRSGKLSPVKEHKTDDNKGSDTSDTPRVRGRTTRKRLVIEEAHQTELDSEVSEEVDSEKRITRARNRLSLTPRTRTKSSGSTKGLGTDQDALSETERTSGPSRSLRSRGGPSTSSGSFLDALPPVPASIDSNPSSPSSSTTNSVIMEDEKDYPRIKKALQVFHEELLVNRAVAACFQKKNAVEPSAKYLTTVKRPLDLDTILQRVESGDIRSWVHMKREVLLMIINFSMFYPTGHELHTAAQNFYNQINKLFDMDFENLVSTIRTEDVDPNKTPVAKIDGDTASDSEQKSVETKPKGKPGRKRRTPSISVEETVETKRRTLRTSTTAVTTSSWQGARKSKQQQSPDIVSS